MIQFDDSMRKQAMSCHHHHQHLQLLYNPSIITLKILFFTLIYMYPNLNHVKNVINIVINHVINTKVNNREFLAQP